MRASGDSPGRAATVRSAPVLAGVLLVVAVASRLPQLSSPYLILDGDEAILGLMARHLLDGRAWPWFFYGQGYGLSIVEVAAGAAAFAVAGMGAIPLKLGMLALWAVAVAAHFAALGRLVGATSAFWTLALLVMTPAWAVWSMKARGGYLTAFAATGAALVLLVRVIERGREGGEASRQRCLACWSGVGLLIGLVYLSQRLWLPGLVPIVLSALVAERRRGVAVSSMGLATLLLVGGVGWAAGLPWATLAASPRERNLDLLGSLPAFLERMHTAFTGSYYLWVPIEPGPITWALATATMGMLAALVVLQIHRAVRRWWLLWSHLFAASTIITLGAVWVLVGAPDARYLLPVVAWVWLWAGVEVADLARRGLAPPAVRAAVGGSVLALGLLSCLEFRDYTYLWDQRTPPADEQAALDTLIGHLRDHGVGHAFATNGLLQWQVTFYSRETVVARYLADRDRHQPYVTAVDRALEAGAPVALVGYVRAMADVEALVGRDALFVVGGRYFACVGPDETLLRQLGFRFSRDRR